MWLTSKEMQEKFKITRQTLCNWKRTGVVVTKAVNTRKVLYDSSSVAVIGDELPRINVVYARVSNTKQKDDMDRQCVFIKEYMISNGVVPDMVLTDIASGMNEERTNFNKLVHLVVTNQVKKVYISYKDRLTRFGFAYFEKLFAHFDTEIVVINLTDESDFQQELTEDLVSIIHHFSMKMYSNRRKILKQAQQDLLASDDNN